MAVAQRGSLLATGGTDGTVWLYEAATTAGTTQTRLVATLPHTQKQLIESAALSPDGRTLVTGSADGTLQVTDVSDPAAPRSAGAPVRSDGVAYVLAFSPDGHRLAAGSGSPDRVTLWNLADPAHPERTAASPDGPTLQLSALAFSPDGRTLATGSADRSVQLLDVSDAAHPHWIGAPMLGAGDVVHGVAFDQAGTTVAAAGGDGAVRLWDVTDLGNPALVATLTAGGSDPLYAVAFDRTQSRLAAAGAGTTVRQWDTDPTVAGERICRVAGAPISDSEWGRYVPTVPYAAPCSS
jgi:WD40 repeat protein